MRLNKYLSASGVFSRREADRFIMSGRVSVNGVPAVPGTKVTGREDIRVDGERVKASPDTVERVVLAYYKERGIVCSSVNQGGEHNNIIEKIDYPVRVFPVGRLDKDSEGLILLTNDGDLVNLLLKGSNRREKEYEVTLNKEISDEDIKKMAKGGLELVPGRISKPLVVRRSRYDDTDTVINVILTEGINREIRRMAEAFGYRVKKLKRVRFASITLKGLKPGLYRRLSREEIASLKSLPHHKHHE